MMVAGSWSDYGSGVASAEVAPCNFSVVSGILLWECLLQAQPTSCSFSSFSDFFKDLFSPYEIPPA